MGKIKRTSIGIKQQFPQRPRPEWMRNQITVSVLSIIIKVHEAQRGKELVHLALPLPFLRLP